MKKIVISIVAASVMLTAAELDPIVVSATKSETPLSLTTANTVVITSDEIKERRYRDLLDAVKNIAGVSYTQSGGVGQQSSLYLRGMNNKYTLVLIDGMRVNDTTNFDGAFFDQISLADVERIEIIKGAGSAIWGADAAAGVINIITKKAQPHHINAYVSGGSYGTKNFGATLSHAMEMGDIRVGFDRYLTDGFSAAEPAKSSPDYKKRYDDLGWERDRYSATTFFAKAGLNITPKDRLELNHRELRSFVEFDDAGVDKPFSVEVDPMWGNTSYYSNRYKEQFSKASYKHSEDSFDIEVYGSRSGFERGYYGGYKGKTTELGAVGSYRYLGDDTLTLGLTKQKFAISNLGGNNIENDSYSTDAIFVTNTNFFNNNTTILTESIRYDDYSIFGSKTTAKVGAKQIIGDGAVSANYGSSYRAPNLAELYPPSSWWMVPNSDLKPETIKSFDISAEYGGLSLTYFYNTIDNMINTNSTFSQYINVSGRSKFQGYEASYTQNIGDSLLLDGSYTRLYAKDSSGKDLKNRAKNLYKASVTYFPLEALSINLNGQYIGDRVGCAAGSFPCKDVQTGKYAVVGGVVNYQLNPNIELFARFDNLFNRYYQEVDGYATAGRSAYVGARVNY